MSNDGNKDWEFNHIEVKRDLKNFVTTLVMDHPPISEKEARINTIGPELLDDLATDWHTHDIRFRLWFGCPWKESKRDKLLGRIRFGYWKHFIL